MPDPFLAFALPSVSWDVVGLKSSEALTRKLHPISLAGRNIFKVNFTQIFSGGFLKSGFAANGHRKKMSFGNMRRKKNIFSAPGPGHVSQVFLIRLPPWVIFGYERQWNPDCLSTPWTLNKGSFKWPVRPTHLCRWVDAWYTGIIEGRPCQ